jgi:hypothetical protein
MIFVTKTDRFSNYNQVIDLYNGTHFVFCEKGSEGKGRAKVLFNDGINYKAYISLVVTE